MGDFNTVTKQTRVDFRPSSLNNNQQLTTTNKRISIKGCSIVSMVPRDVSWIETFKLLWLWRSAPFVLGKIKSNFLRTSKFQKRNYVTLRPEGRKNFWDFERNMQISTQLKWFIGIKLKQPEQQQKNTFSSTNNFLSYHLFRSLIG